MDVYRIQKAISKALMGIGIIFLSIATVVLFIGVVQRYFFSVSYTWMEEVSRYLSVSTGFALIGHVIFWNKDVTLDIVISLIKSKKLKWFMQVVSTAIVGVTAVLLVKWGIDAWSNAGDNLTYTLLFPLKLPYSFVPIGMAILAIYCILKLVILLKDRNTDYFESANENTDDADTGAERLESKSVGEGEQR